MSAYFAIDVLNVISELLDYSKDETIQTIGCQSLTRFIYCQVDSTYTRNIEKLVRKVCTLSLEPGETHEKRCLRASSLQCLSAMVGFMTEFSHIFADFDEIVYATLDNYEWSRRSEEADRTEAHHNWVDEVVRSESRTGLDQEHLQRLAQYQHARFKRKGLANECTRGSAFHPFPSCKCSNSFHHNII